MTNASSPLSHVTIGDVTFGNDLPIAIFAGPCAMESRQHALEMAGALKEICGRLGIGLVYKSSFDKANTVSNSILLPGSASRKSTSNCWPSSTLNCFPLSLMIAYILLPTAITKVG